MSTLYEDLKAAGVPIDSHESDLYFKLTDESREILSHHRDKLAKPTSFASVRPEDEGAAWCEVPFAFDPFWKAKASR